jgi:HD-like signal output (HDOD) protein
VNSSAVSQTSSIGSRRTSILFVDDEEGVLASLRSLFHRDGYELLLFTGGREALDFLKETSVDIIVSDLRMPSLTGIEFLNQAGTLCPNATRIMLSGYEDKAVILQSLGKGLAQYYVLKPWEDESFKQLISESIDRIRQREDRHLRKILGKMETLPTAPRLYLHLSTILSRPESSLRELVAEIEKNPPVVAKLLQVANSVYYGARNPVMAVRDAVTFVGTEYVEGLVLAIEAFQNASTCRDAGSVEMIEQLWLEAVARATLAKAIAERWERFSERNLVYVTSLLQDIGLVVRACADPGRFKRFLVLLRDQQLPLADADAMTFGIPHEEVGATLLSHWNFPLAIVNTVSRHHRPPGESALMCILQIAESIAGGFFAPSPSTTLTPLVSEWRERILPVLTSPAPPAGA